jgi:phosphoadenosine phosphosulfate reductase
MRAIDRIDTAPRFTQADADQLNVRFADIDTADMLCTALAGNLLGNSAIVSSFGTESAVLLNLIAQINPDIPVLFLETGKHFPETLAYRDLLAARLGLTDVRNITPDTELLAGKDASGERWSYDPDGCCDIRKVQPLAIALSGFDSQFTGRKSFQAATRSALPRFEIADGMLKVNPLADWDKARIDAYMAQHDLPAHPLVEQGYLSIGCATCTSPVKPGEDARAGRWRGQDKVECGLHSLVSVLPNRT